MVSKTWILNTPRHFFWYTTCIPYHSFALHFCTWWPSPTKMTVKTYSFQDLSYDIRHAYLLRTLDFYTWWLRPTPSMGSKTLFFFNFGTYSSRPFFFIYDMPVFEFLYLMNPPHPGVLKIWKLKHIHQYLSYDMQLAYHLRTSDFYTWWPHPTPSNGSYNKNSETYSSRPFIWYTTCLP
jgi:hypothetical protein